MKLRRLTMATVVLTVWSIVFTTVTLADQVVDPGFLFDFSTESSGSDLEMAATGSSTGQRIDRVRRSDLWGYDTGRYQNKYLGMQNQGTGSSLVLAMAQDSLDQQLNNGKTGDSAGESAPKDDAAAIAAAMLNPLSYLWLMFTQNDTIHYEGDTLDTLGKDGVNQNITLLMPVLSQQLTEDWKMIFRPVIPVLSVETLGNVDISTSNTVSVQGVDLERESGLGDIVLWTGFSKSYEPPNIFGFGATFMLDTATEDQLGTGKYAAGPMALAFRITEKWVFGIVAQHWWSFAGEDYMDINTSLGKVKVARPDVNLTDIQPVIRYRYSAMTNIGMAPNWRYNHETDQLDLPIGIGFDTMVKLGPLPAKIGAEVYYFVEQSDDFGPKWQIRFLFVPVLPAPEFSRKPLFR